MTSNEMEELSINDPRVSKAFRESADVQKLMADGCRLYWNRDDCRVHLIKPDDGKVHRVTVSNALQKPTTTTPTRRDRARARNAANN